MSTCPYKKKCDKYNKEFMLCERATDYDRKGCLKFKSYGDYVH